MMTQRGAVVSGRSARGSGRSPAASRILVGVADAARRHRLGATLARAGFDVRAAHTGYHALRQLADAVFDPAVRRPDALVVDAVMPGVTGLSLITGLRDLGWRTPAVLLSPNPARLRARVRALGSVWVLDRRTPPARVAHALARLVDHADATVARTGARAPASLRVRASPRWSSRATRP